MRAIEPHVRHREASFSKLHEIPGNLQIVIAVKDRNRAKLTCKLRKCKIWCLPLSLAYAAAYQNRMDAFSEDYRHVRIVHLNGLIVSPNRWSACLSTGTGTLSTAASKRSMQLKNPGFFTENARHFRHMVRPETLTIDMAPGKGLSRL